MNISLQELAQALGGEISNGQVLAPGPQHSPKDRSLAVKLSGTAPDGFVVCSFAGDDDIECRDYVRAKVGGPAFKLGRKANGTAGGKAGAGAGAGAKYKRRPEMEAMLAANAAALAQHQGDKPSRGRITRIYDYTDAAGALVLQVLRHEPKGFSQRRPDPDHPGGWINNLHGVLRVPYRLPEVLRFPDATLFVTEGEKDADSCAALGLCATTAAGSKWTASCIRALTGRETPFADGDDRPGARDIVILRDNDEPGRKKALAAAQTLHGYAKTIRIVLLPGLPPAGDLTDWLEDTAAVPRHDGDLLVKLCLQVEPWAPDGSAAENATDAADDNEPHPENSDIEVIDVAAWHGKPVPERDWVVRDRIIRRNVASLSGEGGVGKSILVMQLAVAHVIGGDWLASLPEKGPAIYFNAEDDEQELHRRLAAIVRHAGCGLNDLAGLHLITRAGKDAVLGAPDRNGIIRPTPIFKALNDLARSIKPQIVIVDTAADIFAGNENDRAQVRQFIGLLRGLAIDANCGVLVVSHPSLTGINSGSGTSGTTGWHNSVRSRLYFKAAKDAGDDVSETGVRELVIKKNNYGPSGETVRLFYEGGVFKPVSSPSSLERAAAEQKAEQVFMTLFDRLIAQGRTFSPSRNSPENYPPKVFAAHPDGQGIGIKTFEDAQQRLLDAGTIRIETVGKQSQPRKQLVRT